MVKKMHVKKGDNVVVIAGKDNGKQGKVLSVDPDKGRVVVDKVNVVKRHTKPSKAMPQGGIIDKEAYVDSSNVMLYCPKCKKGVRVGKNIDDKGQKTRVCVKCGESFDK